MLVSSTNSQPGAGQVAILTILLSSSVLLAMITGLFYLVGGSLFQGYWYALGLSYLSSPQSAEYVFTGAESLLVPSFVWISATAIVLALAGATFVTSVQAKRIPRTREALVATAVLVIATFTIVGYADREVNRSRTLITSTCRAIPRSSDSEVALWFLCLPMVTTAFGFFFFEPRHLRVLFLSWGFVASTFYFYVFGRALGAAQLYAKFNIVEVDSTSLQLSPQSRLLVLGADDKNLVVLTPDVNHEGHLEPKYFLRSEIKSFSVVGKASINDFVCNGKSRPAPLPRQ